MIGAGDALGLIDQLAVWLSGALDWLPQRARMYLAVPIVVAAVLIVPRVAVHRVLPWLGRYVLVPVTALVTCVVVSAALIVDFALARLFRLFWLPLTGVHYAVGDWAIAGTRGVRAAVRYRTYRVGWWLSRFSPGALLVAGIAITILWNAGYCERNPGAGCVDPLVRWWRDVWLVWPSIWD